MKIQRLSWAGLKIETPNCTFLVDAVENFAYNPKFSLAANSTYRFSANTKADYALITHLHFDHYDPKAITAALKPDSFIICSSLIADEVQKNCFNKVKAINSGESLQLKQVQFTPVFAMDGIGDEQVSWVIESDGYRIIHCGDTIWHNQFWRIGEKYKHFDLAFLPVNGAVVRFPDLPYSPVAAAMTPMEAVAAAKLLHSKRLIPIHFGINVPNLYEEFPKVVESLKSESIRQKVDVELYEAGAYISP